MRVTIAGTGLLGGSLGLALRRRGGFRVAGLCRRAAAAEAALARGAVDEASTDPSEVIPGTDVLVLCVPVDAMAGVSEGCLPWMERGSCVTDVGSVKKAIVEELDPLWRDAGISFVGGHPMAGSEKTGIEQARADLFRGATVVLTPAEGCDEAALSRVESLWEAAAARVVRMDAAEHDRLVGRTSHLIHVLAAAAAAAVLGGEDAERRAVLCGGGFRDTTRVALGSPGMWSEILLANAAEVLEGIREFEAVLRDAARALEAGDSIGMTEWLERARRARALFADGTNAGEDA